MAYSLNDAMKRRGFGRAHAGQAPWKASLPSSSESPADNPPQDEVQPPATTRTTTCNGEANHLQDHPQPPASDKPNHLQDHLQPPASDKPNPPQDDPPAFPSPVAKYPQDLVQPPATRDDNLALSLAQPPASAKPNHPQGAPLPPAAETLNHPQEILQPPASPKAIHPQQPSRALRLNHPQEILQPPASDEGAPQVKKNLKLLELLVISEAPASSHGSNHPQGEPQPSANFRSNHPQEEPQPPADNHQAPSREAAQPPANLGANHPREIDAPGDAAAANHPQPLGSSPREVSCPSRALPTQVPAESISNHPQEPDVTACTPPFNPLQPVEPTTRIDIPNDLQPPAQPTATGDLTTRRSPQPPAVDGTTARTAVPNRPQLDPQPPAADGSTTRKLRANHPQGSPQPPARIRNDPLPTAAAEKTILCWLLTQQLAAGDDVTPLISKSLGYVSLGMPPKTFASALERLVKAGRLQRHLSRAGKIGGGTIYRIPDRVMLAMTQRGWVSTARNISANHPQALTSPPASLDPTPRNIVANHPHSVYQPPAPPVLTTRNAPEPSPLSSSSSHNKTTPTDLPESSADSRIIERQLEQLLVCGYPLAREKGVTASSLLAAVRKALKPHPEDSLFGITNLADALEVIELAAWYLEQCARAGKGTPNSWPAYIGAALRDGYHARSNDFKPWILRRQLERAARLRAEREELEAATLEAQKEGQKVLELKFQQFRRSKTEAELREMVASEDPTFKDFALNSPMFIETLREFFLKQQGRGP